MSSVVSQAIATNLQKFAKDVQRDKIIIDVLKKNAKVQNLKFREDFLVSRKIPINVIDGEMHNLDINFLLNGKGLTNLFVEKIFLNCSINIEMVSEKDMLPYVCPKTAKEEKELTSKIFEFLNKLLPHFTSSIGSCIIMLNVTPSYKFYIGFKSITVEIEKESSNDEIVKKLTMNGLCFAACPSDKVTDISADDAIDKITEFSNIVVPVITGTFWHKTGDKEKENNNINVKTEEMKINNSSEMKAILRDVSKTLHSTCIQLRHKDFVAPANKEDMKAAFIHLNKCGVFAYNRKTLQINTILEFLKNRHSYNPSKSAKKVSENAKKLLDYYCKEKKNSFKHINVLKTVFGSFSVSFTINKLVYSIDSENSSILNNIELKCFSTETGRKEIASIMELEFFNKDAAVFKGVGRSPTKFMTLVKETGLNMMKTNTDFGEIEVIDHVLFEQNVLNKLSDITSMVPRLIIYPHLPGVDIEMNEKYNDFGFCFNNLSINVYPEKWGNMQIEDGTEATKLKLNLYNFEFKRKKDATEKGKTNAIINIGFGASYGDEKIINPYSMSLKGSSSFDKGKMIMDWEGKGQKLSVRITPNITLVMSEIIKKVRGFLTAEKVKEAFEMLDKILHLSLGYGKRMNAKIKHDPIKVKFGDVENGFELKFKPKRTKISIAENGESLIETGLKNIQLLGLEDIQNKKFVQIDTIKIKKIDEKTLIKVIKTDVNASEKLIKYIKLIAPFFVLMENDEKEKKQITMNRKITFVDLTLSLLDSKRKTKLISLFFDNTEMKASLTKMIFSLHATKIEGKRDSKNVLSATNAVIFLSLTQSDKIWKYSINDAHARATKEKFGEVFTKDSVIHPSFFVQFDDVAFNYYNNGCSDFIKAIQHMLYFFKMDLAEIKEQKEQKEQKEEKEEEEEEEKKDFHVDYKFAFNNFAFSLPEIETTFKFSEFYYAQQSKEQIDLNFNLKTFTIEQNVCPIPLITFNEKPVIKCTTQNKASTIDLSPFSIVLHPLFVKKFIQYIQSDTYIYQALLLPTIVLPKLSGIKDLDYFIAMIIPQINVLLPKIDDVLMEHNMLNFSFTGNVQFTQKSKKMSLNMSELRFKNLRTKALFPCIINQFTPFYEECEDAEHSLTINAGLRSDFVVSLTPETINELGKLIDSWTFEDLPIIKFQETKREGPHSIINFNASKIALVICKSNTNSSRNVPILEFKLSNIIGKTAKSQKMNDVAYALFLKLAVNAFNDETSFIDRVLEESEIIGSLTCFSQTNNVEFSVVKSTPMALNVTFNLLKQLSLFSNSDNYLEEEVKQEYGFWLLNLSNEEITVNVFTEEGESLNLTLDIGKTTPIEAKVDPLSTVFSIGFLGDKVVCFRVNDIIYPMPISSTITVMRRSYKGGIIIEFCNNILIHNTLPMALEIFTQNFERVCLVENNQYCPISEGVQYFFTNGQFTKIISEPVVVNRSLDEISIRISTYNGIRHCIGRFGMDKTRGVKVLEIVEPLLLVNYLPYELKFTVENYPFTTKPGEKTALLFVNPRLKEIELSISYGEEKNTNKVKLGLGKDDLRIIPMTFGSKQKVVPATLRYSQRQIYITATSMFFNETQYNLQLDNSIIGSKKNLIRSVIDVQKSTLDKTSLAIVDMSMPVERAFDFISTQPSKDLFLPSLEEDNLLIPLHCIAKRGFGSIFCPICVTITELIRVDNKTGVDLIITPLLAEGQLPEVSRARKVIKNNESDFVNFISSTKKFICTLQNKGKPVEFIADLLTAKMTFVSRNDGSNVKVDCVFENIMFHTTFSVTREAPIIIRNLYQKNVFIEQSSVSIPPNKDVKFAFNNPLVDKTLTVEIYPKKINLSLDEKIIRTCNVLKLSDTENAYIKQSYEQGKRIITVSPQPDDENQTKFRGFWFVSSISLSLIDNTQRELLFLLLKKVEVLTSTSNGFISNTLTADTMILQDQNNTASHPVIAASITPDFLTVNTLIPYDVIQSRFIPYVAVIMNPISVYLNQQLLSDFSQSLDEIEGSIKEECIASPQTTKLSKRRRDISIAWIELHETSVMTSMQNDQNRVPFFRPLTRILQLPNIDQNKISIPGFIVSGFYGNPWEIEREIRRDYQYTILLSRRKVLEKAYLKVFGKDINEFIQRKKVKYEQLIVEEQQEEAKPEQPENPKEEQPQQEAAKENEQAQQQEANPNDPQKPAEEEQQIPKKESDEEVQEQPESQKKDEQPKEQAQNEEQPESPKKDEQEQKDQPKPVEESTKKLCNVEEVIGSFNQYTISLIYKVLFKCSITPNYIECIAQLDVGRISTRKTEKGFIIGRVEHEKEYAICESIPKMIVSPMFSSMNGIHSIDEEFLSVKALLDKMKIGRIMFHVIEGSAIHIITENSIIRVMTTSKEVTVIPFKGIRSLSNIETSFKAKTMNDEIAFKSDYASSIKLFIGSKL